MKRRTGGLALLLILICLLGAGCAQQGEGGRAPVEVSPTPTGALSTPSPRPTTILEETPPLEGPAPTPTPEQRETFAPAHSPAPETTPEAEQSCSLTVRCDVLLDRLEELDPAVADLVPEDGILLKLEKISFQEGETVFDLLQRELREAGIHLEYTSPPAYQSAYVEGIGNLYEFDCGDLSGWTYRVNGTFPGYGSSRYPLSDGDVVEWVYTCDLGRDVGWQEGG